ncbi:MAG: hypothetical protein O7J95_06635 [Planctomycetota bacterium]|nr:hypothetical protein [Planctomycetota bacterium]
MISLSTPADFLIRLTAVLALALYALSRRGGVTRHHAATSRRTLSTAGFLVFLAHVGCAFHFYHGWSHDSAYRETAQRTAEVLGVAWGGGLYFNYAFTLGWALDTLWWWLAPERYHRNAHSWRVAWGVYFAFLAIQSTVVFGTDWVRWIGAGAAAVWLAHWIVTKRHQDRYGESTQGGAAAR